MHYSQQLIIDYQGYSGHRAELFPQESVDDRECREVIHHERLSCGGDMAGETLPHRHVYLGGYRLFGPTSHSHRQGLICRVKQEDSGIVYTERLLDPLKQRGKQVIECKMGEGGISEGLQGSQVLVGALLGRTSGIELLSLSDIANADDDQIVTLLVKRAKTRLEREHAPIAPPPRQRRAGTHGTHERCGRIVRTVLLVDRAQTLREKQLDGPSLQLVGGVSKEFLRPPVNQTDAATGVCHQGGVGG
jgi:hypothetical protein